MWTTSSKIAFAALSIILLLASYFLGTLRPSDQEITKIVALETLMSQGKLDSAEGILTYTSNTGEYNKELLASLAVLSEGYIMVRLFDKFSDEKDLLLWRYENNINVKDSTRIYTSPKDRLLGGEKEDNEEI
jgi:hypothetical protein